MPLADWAKKRAAFYDDKELAQKALAAYKNGIEAEYRQLLVKQPELLLKLADPRAAISTRSTFLRGTPP